MGSWKQFIWITGMFACCAAAIVPAARIAVAQDNPFAPYKLSEIEKKRRRQQWIERGLVESGLERARQMRHDDNDAHALEGVLSALHAETAHPLAFIDRVDLLRELAARPWRAGKSESARGFFERLAAEYDGAPDAELVKTRANYVRLPEPKAWPLDWRSAKDRWITLAATLLATKNGGEPLSRWRELSAADERRADLYRQAYVAAAEARRETPLDWEFLAPYTSVEGALDANRIVRAGATLRAAVATGEKPDEPSRALLRKRLVDLASSGQHELPTLEAFGTFCRIVPQSAQENRQIETALLQHARPHDFRRFAETAGLSSREICHRFLAKHIEVEYRKAPLGDAILQIADKADLPIYIDGAWGDDAPRLTMKGKGTWLDVMDLALAGSGYELLLLRDDVLWLGPSSKREQAVELFRDAFARLPDRAENPRMWSALTEPVEFFFLESQLAEIGEYLKDVHHIEIRVAKRSADARITSLQSILPFCYIMQMICHDAGLDWCAAGPFVAIGTPEEVKAYRRMAEDHRMKIARLDARGSPLTARLADEVKLDIRAVPLSAVVESMKQRHKDLKFQLATGLRPDIPITYSAKGVPLGWALVDMLFSHDLTWDVVGGKILIEPLPIAPAKPPKGAAARGGADNTR